MLINTLTHFRDVQLNPLVQLAHIKSIVRLLLYFVYLPYLNLLTRANMWCLFQRRNVCLPFVFVAYVSAETRKQLQERDKRIVDLERLISELKTMSYDGIQIWKLSNFPRMLSSARASQGPSSFYSQPFYTHRFGYKLCGRVYLNGDGSGRGSHVSLFIVVMQVSLLCLLLV